MDDMHDTLLQGKTDPSGPSGPSPRGSSAARASFGWPRAGHTWRECYSYIDRASSCFYTTAMASRQAGCVPLDQQVELLREENNALKRENKALSRTHEANAELQHQVDTLKREIKALTRTREENTAEEVARTNEANTELQHQVDTLKRELVDSTYYNRSGLQVAHRMWVFALDVLHALNRTHSNFRGVFFDDFRALLGENDEAYVCRLADYVRWIPSKYVFVRVERPPCSRNFVLAYVKCDWVF